MSEALDFRNLRILQKTMLRRVKSREVGSLILSLHVIDIVILRLGVSDIVSQLIITVLRC